MRPNQIAPSARPSLAHFPSVPGSVTTKADLSKIVVEIEKQAADGIHILFNNAGVAGEGSREGYEPTDDAEKFKEQLWKSSEEEWARILNVNVIGYYVSGHRTIGNHQPLALLTDS